VRATFLGYEMQFSQYLQQSHIFIGLVLSNITHPSPAATRLMTPKEESTTWQWTISSRNCSF